MIIKEISIKELVSRENIRQITKEEDIPQLMQSIKSNGLLQPIGVKEEKDNYRVLWGNRRIKACDKLGWKEIPAVIFLTKGEEMSEEDFYIINAIENLHQKPNTLFELGRICEILKKTMSPSEIAVRLSIPKSRVIMALGEMTRIPKKWHKKIRVMNDSSNKQGKIPLSTASIVGRLRGLSDKQKDKLLEHISKNEEGTLKVGLIGSLMKSGKTLKKSLKIADDWKFVDTKLFINKKKYEEVVKEYDGNFTEFLIDTLNRREKNLAIKSIKIGSLGEINRRV